MKDKKPICIHWFRRDLRLDDNAALYHALKSGLPVLPLFIFDKAILDALEEKEDRRVAFIHLQLQKIQQQLSGKGVTLDVRYGTVEEVWKSLVRDYSVACVYTNHDYEPYARKRDQAVHDFLLKEGISFKTFKDQVIFEKDEIIKDDGKPYTVYTPYSHKWMARLNAFYTRSYPTEKYDRYFYRQAERKLPSLGDIGFRDCNTVFPSDQIHEDLIIHYGERRDFPGTEGTSRLGIHLRFGTLSIRKLVRTATSLSKVWLNELCWREFYMMILWHFPHVTKGAFKPAYDRIPWRNDEREFAAWCQGQTGYPVVDAGMRELNATGYMHNRVRMITAGFLTRHLLIDWRWGEVYFAARLLDFDLSANNGGWQWAAGSGCDAAPYFRIFNPWEQTRRFDPDLKYIRKWVPEVDDFGYPAPIVDHAFARKRCLDTYKSALGAG